MWGNCETAQHAFIIFGMKQGSRVRGSSAKNTGAETVDKYLALVPEPARSTLNKSRDRVRSAVPTHTTEVISYQIPAFKIDTPTHQGMIVWYAAFANHCSLFPTASVIEKFKEELKGYRLSKGTIQFPVNQPLPAALLKKMVKARLSAIERKRK
jgi:uncharacterized protein YdhG (YjbR/CyaY superfamily)